MLGNDARLHKVAKVRQGSRLHSETAGTRGDDVANLAQKQLLHWLEDVHLRQEAKARGSDATLSSQPANRSLEAKPLGEDGTCGSWLLKSGRKKRLKAVLCSSPSQ